MTNEQFKQLKVGDRIAALDNNEVVAVVVGSCAGNGQQTTTNPSDQPVVGYQGPQLDQQPVDTQQRDADVAKSISKSVTVQQIVNAPNYNTYVYMEADALLRSACFTPEQARVIRELLIGTAVRIASNYYTKAQSDERFVPIDA